jgi:hypothetical protein
MKQTILFLFLLAGLLLSGCSKSGKQAVYTGPPLNDVEFAKRVFSLLAEGDEAVLVMVDWAHLKMIGVDVGRMYLNISGDSARDKFLKGFISGYSKSFKERGGSVDNVSNWRELSRDASNTIVTADGPGGKPLLMTVAHVNGQQKVSTLELK